MTEPLTSSPAPTPVAADPASRSRRALVVGVAAVAGLAGAGLAWRRWQPSGDDGQSAAVLWEQGFETPAGSGLDMAGLRGKPLLVNFWATWCPPCVEELPLLDRFHRAQAAQGWQVLGIAIDQPSAVRRFLEKTPVAFPVAMAGLQGTELSKSLGNAAGGLPFSVALDGQARVRHRKIGQLSPSDLAAWARA